MTDDMPHLLLLEDDESLIDGLAYALPKNGFTLDIARSVKEAEALRKSHPYDLYLLDVTLPDGTGFSVCEHARAEGCRVPIVFLTASDKSPASSAGWTAAQTTTSPNPSGWASYAPACAPSCAAARGNRYSARDGWRSTGLPEGRFLMGKRST